MDVNDGIGEPSAEMLARCFTVTVHPHPLTQERVQALVEEGPTLADLGAGPGVLAYLNGNQAEPSARPRAGEHVLLRAIPAGGDSGSKDVLRLVGTLAILYLSYGVAAPALTGAGGLLAGWNAGVVGAGLSLAGQLALNAIIPPPNPALDLDANLTARQERAITGISNQAVPMGPIPRLYGKARFYPPQAGRFFTEQVGDAQYLRCLFCLGYGPLDIDTTSFRIGDTALTEFEDVQTEVLEGKSGDPPLTLYTRNIAEAAVSFLFDADDDAPQVLTTAAGSAQASIDIVAPMLKNTNDDPMVLVGFKVEYRTAGSGSYTAVTPTIATVTGDGGYQADFPRGAFESIYGGSYSYPDGSSGPAFYIAGGENKPFAVNVLIKFASVGQYDIRVTRVTTYGLRGTFVKHLATPAAASGDYITAFYWTRIRSIKPEDSPVVPIGPYAYIAMRIRATEQLSGQLDNFSCIATARLQTWNGSAWVEAATSNPAYAFRDALIGSANARAVASARVNDTQLKTWATLCASKTWEFNAVIDGRTTLYEVLQQIAAQGRASLFMPDGLYGVVIDQAQSAAVQVFTPRNAWDFSGERAFPDLPHAINVRFVNRNRDWIRDQRVVYDDGYSETGTGCTFPGPGGSCVVATKFETLTLFGETNPDIAWKHGRYRIACARLQPETFRFKVAIENIVCTRGDRIQVQHDAILVGLGSARVLQLPGGSQARFDEPFTVESGKTYQVQFRRADGTFLTRTVTNSPGTYTQLAFSATLSGIAVGNLASFGETGKVVFDAMVKTITPGEDFTAEIECVPYNAAIYTADVATVPAYDPNVSQPAVAPEEPVIVNVLSGARARLRSNDGSGTPRILAAYVFPSSAVPVSRVQGRIRRVGDTGFEVSADQENSGVVTWVIPDENADYEIGIRGISPTDVPGPWASAIVTRQEIASADVTALTLQEQTNSPATPNRDLSTVIAKVTPPSDANYSHSLIDYRKLNAPDWFLIGPTDSQNQARVVLNTDGTTYEFRARVVSKSGYIDSGGVTAQITLANADNQASNPDAGAPTLSTLNVSNLHITGQSSGVTNFTGRDCSMSWNAVSPPSGFTIRDYRVRIIDPATGNPLRTQYVVDETFVYSYDMNLADSALAGYTSARRQFTVEVICRTVQGSISATAATKTVQNPQPTLPGDFTHSAGFTSLELRMSKPTDDDFVGVKVYVSTSSPVAVNNTTKKYDGPEFQPIIISGLSSSTQYFFKVVLVDVFGDGTASAEFNDTTAFLPGEDASPPTVPTGLTLTSSVQETDLFVTGQLTANWTASTDNSGRVQYEVEYWTNSAEKITDRSTLTSYTVFPARVGDTYSFRVRALDYNGNASAFTSTATKTISGDSTPPANVSGAAAVAGLNKVILAWDNPSDSDFLLARVFRGTTSGFTPSSSNRIAEIRTDALVDADVVNGTAYYYKFTTVDVSGNESTASAAVGPVTPFSLDVTNIDNFVNPGAITGTQVALATLAQAHLRIGDFTNLAENADFELGNVSWASKTTGWTIVNEPANTYPPGGTGQWSGKRPGNASIGAMRNDARTACLPTNGTDGGDVFYARAWFKSSAASAGGNVRISYRDQTGALLGTGGNVDGNTVGTGTSWELSEKTSTAPAGAAYVEIAVLGRNTVGQGDLYVDEVALFRVSTGATIADGSITASKIVAGSISTDRLAVSDLQNYVANPGFELADDGSWTKGGSWSIGTTNPYKGTMAATRASSTGSATSLINIEFAPIILDAGETFYGSCMIRRASGTLTSGGGWARLEFVDSSGSVLSSVDGTFEDDGTTLPTTTYRLSSATGTAPAGAVGVRIVCRANNNGVAIFADNFTLRRVNKGVLIEDGAITAVKIAVGTITADRIAAYAITADRLLITDITNKVYNPGFEEGDVGKWTKGTGWTVVASNPRTGTWAAKHTPSASATFITNNWKVPVTPGVSYYASCWGKFLTTLGSGGVGDFKVNVNWIGADGTTSVQNNNGDVITVATATGTYTISTLKMAAPATAAYAQIRCRGNNLNTDGSNQSDLYVDDFFFHEQSGATIIQDGSITTNHITVAGLDAAVITTGSLIADVMSANVVSAIQVNVTQLSAIRADLGEMTAGTITGLLIRTANATPRIEMSTLNGLRGINATGTTFKLAVDGSGFFGLGGKQISWDTAGNVTVPGTISGGVFSGDLIKTSGSGIRVEMGPRNTISGEPGHSTTYLLYVGDRTSSGTKFAVDQSGNLYLAGNIAMSTGGDLHSGKTTGSDTTHTGFFLGVESGVGKFRIGNGTTEFSWDGTNLTAANIRTATSGQRVELTSGNEQKFYADRGDGTVEALCTVGRTANGADYILLDVGSPNSSLVGLRARSKADAIEALLVSGAAAGATALSGDAGTNASCIGVSGYGRTAMFATASSSTAGQGLVISPVGSGRPSHTTDVSSGGISARDSGDLYVYETGAWKKFAIDASKANVGWAEMGDGSIIQWGNGSAADGSTISFAISFPTACRAVAATDTNGASVLGTSSRGTTGFTLEHNNGATATGYSYVAVGY